MASSKTVTFLEQCHVSPAASTTADLSLPLTIFDAPWIGFHVIQRLFFFNFTHNKTYFIENTIPSLKESLSLTLKHFFPLAGNLIYPSDSSGKPEIKYSIGDSISLTFAESNDDFSYLVGNDPKTAHRFYPLAPELKLASSEISGNKIVPHLALQVTLFPNSGICITCTDSHSITDANVVVGFLKAWGSVYKNKGDAELVATSSVPFLDRSALIKEREVLDRVLSIDPQSINFNLSPAVMLSENLVRASFVICEADVVKLKQSVRSKSGVAVTCAYIWICRLKAMNDVGEKVDESENVHFILSVDCRTHLDPPIASTYMGNCVAPCIATSRIGDLLRPEGLKIAAELIGDACDKRVADKEGLLKGGFISELEEVNWSRSFGAAGLVTSDVYDTDFGWGNKLEKFESISTDMDGSMSLEKSGKFEGGFEISLSMAKQKMVAFTSIFTNGLRDL
ncbi:hypothetical protein ACH5RR_027918 [Cinchona calisaya]|uniref:Uncharacterized protein n=1 Tax=Cinchona calisaya TaxID=153742 RepID=A0ABD2YRQ9_9GENT